ncbi:MAG: TPM domain-containing protein [Gloeobacteraceae cyanobacterium ES-bin-316]|nr:TPM domain-containing protein [Ferruginibacter sp.]
MFSFFKKKSFFSEDEKKQIADAIRNAERRTSGEVRVFIESRCRYVDPLDRAAEVFFNLKMNETKDRNAVLLYIAMKDRQLAVFGDEGIHKKVGTDYWNKEVSLLINEFNTAHYGDGISQCVKDIGEALHQYFPFNNDTDKNELPDDIIFGK